MLMLICRITSQSKLSSQKRRMVIRAASTATDELDGWVSWAARCTQQFSPLHWVHTRTGRAATCACHPGLDTCGPCRLARSTDRGLHGRKSSPRAKQRGSVRGMLARNLRAAIIRRVAPAIVRNRRRPARPKRVAIVGIRTKAPVHFAVFRQFLAV